MKNQITSGPSPKKKTSFTLPNMRMASCLAIAASEYNVDGVSFSFTKKEEVKVSYICDAETDKLIRKKMLELFHISATNVEVFHG
jgi:hypothetical protein